nr:MAG TPA: Minor capsid protein [Caudoviricetes sp.]
MSYIIKTKPLQTIYRELGLEERGKVQQFLGKTVADNLTKYVSLKSGTQKDSVNPINGGKQVIINVPYARFQAEGKVMVGVKSRSAYARRGERKVVINKNLKYHSSKLRGAHPFERMKADKRDKILMQTANYARRLDNG